MKRQDAVLVTLIVVLGLGLVMAQDSKDSRTSSDAGESEELAAIRAVGASFVDAYRAKDAKALGALFTENAEIVDDEGEVTRGRPAIVERFAGLFEAKEGGTLEITPESIHLLSPTVAIE